MYIMDTQNEIQKQLLEQSQKMDAIFVSVEKTRKYFLTTMWVSIVAVALPVLGLAVIIPSFLDGYVSSLSDVGEN